MCASRARSPAAIPPWAAVSRRSVRPKPRAARRTASGALPGASASTVRSHNSSTATVTAPPSGGPQDHRGSASGRSQQTTSAPRSRAQRIAASSGEKSASGWNRSRPSSWAPLSATGATVRGSARYGSHGWKSAGSSTQTTSASAASSSRGTATARAGL